MRFVIVMLAVVGLGIWFLGGPHRLAPVDPGRSEVQRPAEPAGAIQAGGGEGRVAASPRSRPTDVPVGTRRLAATVAVPPPIAPSPPLPATLELVSLPPLGGKAAPARTISRAEAVTSVMDSREYQETVTPLARLYLATFGRYPDYEGLNYYTGQREEARPLHEIATEFTRSREFEARYGELDHGQFVELLFNNVMGNSSQADVRAYWTEELASGRMTRGQVLVDLAESGAFRERSAHQVFVAGAYTEILRRTPDPNGYNYWVGQLQAGQPPRLVIDGLLGRR